MTQRAQTMVELADELEKYPALPFHALPNCKLKFIAGFAMTERQRDMIVAALRSTTAPRGIEAREGWKLVPIEPTQDMLDQVVSCADIEPWTNETMREVYQDMVNAAPATLQSQPMQPGQKGVQDYAFLEQAHRDSDWLSLSASEKACYDWPDDTDLHKQCRADYVAGATDYALPQSQPVQPAGKGEPDLVERMQAFITSESKNWVNCGTGALENVEVSPAGKLVQEALAALRSTTAPRGIEAHELVARIAEIIKSNAVIDDAWEGSSLRNASALAALIVAALQSTDGGGQ